MRSDRYVYGLEGGDGFMGVYLFPNSSGCIHEIRSEFYRSFYLSKMVKKKEKKRIGQ